MNKYKHLGIAALCILANCTSEMHATQIFEPESSDTIHVAPYGHDEQGDGTSGNPYRSVCKALEGSSVSSGDTLYIHVASGDYYLDAPLTISSSCDRPVVIYSTGKDKPRLIGGVKVDGWEKCGDNLYRAYVPEVISRGFIFEQFYVNGTRAEMARTPNTNWGFVKGSQEYPFAKGVRSADYAVQRIALDSAELAILKDVPAEKRSDVRFRFYHKWDITQKPANYIDADSGYVYLQGGGMKPWNPIREGSRYIMYNYKEAIDVPGEWYLDKSEGYVYYMPREGEEMSDAFCVAPALHQLVVVKGKADDPVRNIRFENLSFQYAAHIMPRMGIEPMQAAAGEEAAIMIDFAENIRMIDCEVVHTGAYGIWLRQACHGNRVEHCYIADLGAGGIKVGEPYWRTDNSKVTSGNVVHNNIITHAGAVLPCGVGVALFHTSDNEVTHNEISDLRYSGVSIGWVWGYNNSSSIWTTALNDKNVMDYIQLRLVSPAVRNTVAYNHIHHIGFGELSDMGAVYTLGESPGTKVTHNVIHDVWSYDYGGWGLYTDEGSTGVEMSNNLVYRCKSGGFHQHYGKDNIIENNILAFGYYYQVQYTRAEEHTSFSFKHNIILQDEGETLAGAWEKGKIDMDYNLYWHLSGTPSFAGHTWNDWRKMKEPHSLLANPEFKDARNGDFRFVSLKAAKKIGFKPFDTASVGVYGSEEWKAKASLPQSVLDEYERGVISRRNK